MAASRSETPSSSTATTTGGSRNNRNYNTNTAATTTTMIAGIGCGGSGTVRRIRTPDPQDVLSGRGGGINSHPGNKAFREWVHLRKEDYNLARNKKEKTIVATEVVRRVHDNFGRFLQKDLTVAGGNGSHWWVEIDDAKALAKTTQALREGAPKIRMAHQHPDTTASTTITTATTAYNNNDNNNITNKGIEKEKKTMKKRKRKNISSSLSNVSPFVSVQRKQVVPKATVETTQTSIDDEHTGTPDVSIPVSLPSYKSEQMLLPATDYSDALEKLHENAKRAKLLDEQQQEQELVKNQQRTIQRGNYQTDEQHHSTTLVAPLTSNRDFNERYRKTCNPLSMPAVDPFADTPPLMAVTEPDLGNDIPMLRLDVSDPVNRTVTRNNENYYGNCENSGITPPLIPKKTKLHRVHSLALSDYDSSLEMNLNLIMGSNEVEFVNPFADESNVFVSEGHGIDDTQQQRSNAINHTELSENFINSLLPTTLENDLHIYDSSGVNTSTEALNNKNSYQDYFFHDEGPMESDFEKGMKSIMDVVHSDITSPDKDDGPIPSLLIPWHGGSDSSETIKSSNNKKNKMSRHRSFSSRNSWGSLHDGRQ